MSSRIIAAKGIDENAARERHDHECTGKDANKIFDLGHFANAEASRVGSRAGGPWGTSRLDLPA